MRALRVSIFLTESHEFDGPLMVIPGSHETSIRCAGETPENRYEQSLRKQKYGGPTQAALQQTPGREENCRTKGAQPGGRIF